MSVETGLLESLHSVIFGLYAAKNASEPKLLSKIITILFNPQ